MATKTILLNDMTKTVGSEDTVSLNVVGPGTLIVSGNANSSTISEFNATVVVDKTANSTTFDFAPNSAGVFDLRGHFSQDSFTNMNVGDRIELPVTFSDVSFQGNTLSLIENGTTVATLGLTLAPGASPTFTVGFDSTTGLHFVQCACFAAGTRILTVRGEVAVEALREGDAVLTASGAARPIVWIGERRIDCRRHDQPVNVWPVRIRAGAFGEGEPRRDLWLSPDHSVFCDDVLIPIKYLINGATIVQEPSDAIHYYHVELDLHDILVAEGLPAESYLDTGNRSAFANGGAHMMLHPDFSPLNWEQACAPLCVDGPKVTAARRRVHERSIKMSDVHLVASGRSLDPVTIKGKLHRFLLPPGTQDITVASERITANYLGNPNELGVCIGGIVADGKVVELDSPALAEGFHPIERDGGKAWRWTDGSARLHLPHDSGRPFILDLLLCDATGSGHSSAAIEIGRAA